VEHEVIRGIIARNMKSVKVHAGRIRASVAGPLLLMQGEEMLCKRQNSQGNHSLVNTHFKFRNVDVGCYFTLSLSASIASQITLSSKLVVPDRDLLESSSCPILLVAIPMGKIPRFKPAC